MAAMPPEELQPGKKNFVHAAILRSMLRFDRTF
jgi:hypothetical protein